MKDQVDEQTDGLILAALKRAIIRGKPIRLIETGKGEGLFPKELEGRVRDHCISELALFLEVESTASSRAKEVVPGPGAIDYLAKHLEAGEVSRLLSDGLEEVAKRIREIAGKWAVVVSQNDATQRHLSELRDRALEVQACRRKQLEAQIADEPLQSVTQSDFDFLCRVGVHLVNAWSQADNSAVKSQYESVLLNGGFRPIGEVEEQLTFSAKLHESPRPLFPGDPAIVERPGWMAPQLKAQFVLLKARVRPA